MLIASVGGPTKTITLVTDGRSEAVQTRAATVADLLAERNIVRSAEDALDVEPTAAIEDGETIHFRAAVSVTLLIDNTPQTVRSSATTVKALLAERSVTFDRHDRVVPVPAAAVVADDTIRVDHVNSWTELVHKPIAQTVKRLPTFDLALGSSKVVDPGKPGLREVAYLVTRDDARSAPVRRSVFATRVLRQSRARVIAMGVGEYSALASVAERGFNGTIRLARAAITMVATAYTAGCAGCSGITATGQHAGHGVVAVDPSVIPLGSHLYIPGYGHALAGDTGGAIRGNRIDLGMNSNSDAFQFGRRDVTVYVLHK